MTILLPTLAVAFLAFCIWLTVRIVNRRERWAKWTLAATINLPVLYALSVGPAYWAYMKLGEPGWMQDPLDSAFEPLSNATDYAPESVQLYLSLYCSWWMSLAIPDAPDESQLTTAPVPSPAD